MAKNKTTETSESVYDFINAVENEIKRKDSYKLIEILKDISGFEPKMWGPSIIGFGTYHYKYESGHEGDAPLLGFSPRKNALSLYIFVNLKETRLLLEKLGKFKMGKSCIYVNKLSDVDEKVLIQIAKVSLKFMNDNYPSN